jgi:hypothetical protein
MLVERRARMLVENGKSKMKLDRKHVVNQLLYCVSLKITKVVFAIPTYNPRNDYINARESTIRT